MTDQDWERAPGTLWHAVHDAVLVLGPAAPAPLTLRGTAVAAWEAFDRARTAADAAHELAARYGAPEAQVREDLDRFLQLMDSCGALRGSARA